jgi:hypothetical protein
MRKLVLVGAVCGFSPFGFGQMVDTDVHYYVTGSYSNAMIILASADHRIGNGFSIGVGKADPRLTIHHKIPGELIVEAIYNETRTSNPTIQHPSVTNQTYAIYTTARYRGAKKGGVNFYGDGGLGFSLLRHSSTDLPLANDFMIGGGFGAEISAGTKSSYNVGARWIHTSNAGRKRPNFGENAMYYYVGYSWKK